MFIVTFYSYKGGVGRTLALANVAYRLATESEGARVVIIDFDLEAPGIDSIAPFNTPKLPDKGGIVEYIMGYVDGANPNPSDLPSLKPYSYGIDTAPNITVIPAGKKDSRYQECLTRLNWEELYRSRQGYLFFEELKKKIKEEFAPDYLIIDSRTGLADVSGITTHQLADMVVLVFNLNRQNLDGIRKCYSSIVSTSKLPPVKILLVASPIPKEYLLDSDLLPARLQEAVEIMPDAVNSSLEGKNTLIQVPYHPILALNDFALVKDHSNHEVSIAYRRIAEAIQQNNPDEVRYMLDRAFRYRDDNMFQEAEEEFGNVIARYPQNARGLFYYGDYLLKQGKYKDAAEKLTEACDLAGCDAHYLSALGTALTLSGDEETALEKLRKAEALEPGNETILQKIASLYRKLDDSERYFEYIKKLNRIKLPLARLDRIKPAQRFGAIYARFIHTDLDAQYDLDRGTFCDNLEKAVSLDYDTKASILLSVIEKRRTFPQVKELNESLRKEEERLVRDLGNYLPLVRDKVRQGELEDIFNEADLMRLIRIEGDSSANPFKILLAWLKIGRGEYTEAISIIEDLFNIGIPEGISAGLYYNWGYAQFRSSETSDSRFAHF